MDLLTLWTQSHVRRAICGRLCWIYSGVCCVQTAGDKSGKTNRELGLFCSGFEAVRWFSPTGSSSLIFQSSSHLNLINSESQVLRHVALMCFIQASDFHTFKLCLVNKSFLSFSLNTDRRVWPRHKALFIANLWLPVPLSPFTPSPCVSVCCLSARARCEECFIDEIVGWCGLPKEQWVFSQIKMPVSL